MNLRQKYKRIKKENERLKKIARQWFGSLFWNRENVKF